MGRGSDNTPTLSGKDAENEAPEPAAATSEEG